MKRPEMTRLVGVLIALLSATPDSVRARTPEVVDDDVTLVGILSIARENAAVKSATLTVGETVYYITLDEMGTKATAEAPGSTLEVNGSIPHRRSRTSVKLTLKNYTIHPEAAAIVVSARTLHDSYFAKQTDARSKFDGATVQVSGTIWSINKVLRDASDMVRMKGKTRIIGRAAPTFVYLDQTMLAGIPTGGVRCDFGEAQYLQIMRLNDTDKVAIRGTCKGRKEGTEVIVSDCMIVETTRIAPVAPNRADNQPTRRAGRAPRQ